MEAGHVRPPSLPTGASHNAPAFEEKESTHQLVHKPGNPIWDLSGF